MDNNSKEPENLKNEIIIEKEQKSNSDKKEIEKEKNEIILKNENINIDELWDNNSKYKLNYTQLIGIISKGNSYSRNKNEFLCNMLLMPDNIELSNKISSLNLLSSFYKKRKEIYLLFSITNKFDKNFESLMSIEPALVVNVFVRAMECLKDQGNYIYAYKYLIKTKKVLEKNAIIIKKKYNIESFEIYCQEINAFYIKNVIIYSKKFYGEEALKDDDILQIKKIIDILLDNKYEIDEKEYLYAINKKWVLKTKIFIENYIKAKKDNIKNFLDESFEPTYIYESYFDIEPEKNNKKDKDKNKPKLFPAFPGIINNFEISAFKDFWKDSINIDENYFIKKGKKINEDYFLINEKDWKFLTNIFGTTNEIKRKKDNLDLLELKFILFDRRISDENGNLNLLKQKYILINKHLNMKELKQKLIRITNEVLNLEKEEEKKEIQKNENDKNKKNAENKDKEENNEKNVNEKGKNQENKDTKEKYDTKEKEEKVKNEENVKENKEENEKEKKDEKKEEKKDEKKEERKDEKKEERKDEQKEEKKEEQKEEKKEEQKEEKKEEQKEEKKEEQKEEKKEEQKEENAGENIPKCEENISDDNKGNESKKENTEEVKVEKEKLDDKENLKIEKEQKEGIKKEKQKEKNDEEVESNKEQIKEIQNKTEINDHNKDNKENDNNKKDNKKEINISFYILDKNKKDLLIELTYSFDSSNFKYETLFINRIPKDELEDSKPLLNLLNFYKKEKQILIIEIFSNMNDKFLYDLKRVMKSQFKCLVCSKPIENLQNRFKCEMCNYSLFCSEECSNKSKQHIRLDNKLYRLKDKKFNLSELLSTNLDKLIANNSRYGRIGLGNMGNTCYMNSALQCLSNTEDLTKYFLFGSYKTEINNGSSLSSKGCISKIYYDLIDTLWNESVAHILPKQFRIVFCKKTGLFMNSEQQDSQEFLQALLDNLHEDLNRITNKQYKEMEGQKKGESDEEASKRWWDYYKSRENSIIVDLFHGQYKSTIKCLKCGNSSVSYDTYMSLGLPIPTQKTQIQIKLLTQNLNFIDLNIKIEDDLQIKDIIKRAITFLLLNLMIILR